MTTKIKAAESDAEALEAARRLCDIEYPGFVVSDDFALRAYALKNENSKSEPRILLDACDGGKEDQFRLLLCSAGTHNFVIYADADGSIADADSMFDCVSREIAPDCKDATSLFALFGRIVDYVVSSDDVGPADITIDKLAEDPKTYGLEKLNEGKRYRRTVADLRKFLSDMEELSMKYGLDISFDDCVESGNITTANINNDEFAEDLSLCNVYADLLSLVDFRFFDQRKLERKLGLR